MSTRESDARDLRRPKMSTDPEARRPPKPRCTAAAVGRLLGGVALCARPPLRDPGAPAAVLAALHHVCAGAAGKPRTSSRSHRTSARRVVRGTRTTRRSPQRSAQPGFSRAQGVADDFKPDLAGTYSLPLLAPDADQTRAMSLRPIRVAVVLAPWFLSLPGARVHGRARCSSALSIEVTPISARSGVLRLRPRPRGGHPAPGDPTSRSGAVFVLADCGAPAQLAGDIAPLARAVAPFSYVTVYRADLP